MTPPTDTAPHPPTPSSLLWGAATLRAAAGPGTSWLWHGFLAPGAVTLLTSQWKTGKTTLVSILLARLKTGGSLAGLTLAPGRAVVISEESPAQWDLRAARLDFGDHVGWFCRPFKGKPHPRQWVALLDQLADLHASRPLHLVVIDPLAAFLPARSENDAASMLEALAPLQRLTTAGLAVLILHHPRRGKSPAGQAARGSGALSAFADILIEMRHYRRASDPNRRRKLQAFSRYPDTLRQLVIELNADATDYASLGSFEEEEFAVSWLLLHDLLQTAPAKWARRDILRHWPAPSPPDPTTLFRWLQRAVAQGLLRQTGRGARNDPFRYWLPSQETTWLNDPLASLHMPELYPEKPPP
jgi:hypothetical protein